MNTKTLSDAALNIIDSYLKLPIGNGVSTPYYNNRREKIRAGLRARIGKGTIEDIVDEMELIALRGKIDLKTLPEEQTKKLLIEHNLGIDCSGFAYYILDAESKARGFGSLKKNIHFPFAKHVRKLITLLRPVENAGVQTLSHSDNSKKIDLKDSVPGDFISMSYTTNNRALDHIVVIHKIEYENDIPKKLFYTHSIAWPTDGQWNHGTRQGVIDITDISKPINEQLWTENGKTGPENYTFDRAIKAEVCILKRLNWF